MSCPLLARPSTCARGARRFQTAISFLSFAGRQPIVPPAELDADRVTEHAVEAEGAHAPDLPLWLADRNGTPRGIKLVVHTRAQIIQTNSSKIGQRCASSAPSGW